MAQQAFLFGADRFCECQNRVIAFKHVAGDFLHAAVEHLSVHIPNCVFGCRAAPKLPLEQNVRLRQYRGQPVNPDQPAQLLVPPHAPGLGQACPFDVPGHEFFYRQRAKVIRDAPQERLNPLPHPRPGVLGKRRSARNQHSRPIARYLRACEFSTSRGCWRISVPLESTAAPDSSQRDTHDPARKASETEPDRRWPSAVRRGTGIRR